MTETNERADQPVDPLSAAAGGRLEGFDAIKGLAIILVVGIHVLAAAYAGLGQRSGSVTLAFLSLAVPLFIAVSIFFVARETGYDGSATLGTPIRRRLRRIVPLYVAWTVLYVIFDVTMGGTLKDALTGRPILEVIFLGGAYYHLYFLPALIQCLLILPIARWLGGSMARLGAVVVLGGAALGAARLAGDHRLAVDFAHQHWFLVYFPVVVAGVALGARRVRIDARAAAAALAVGAILLIGEALISSTWEAPATSTYARAGIPLAVLAVLALAVEMRRSNAVLGGLAWLGRRSLGVYLVHPAVLYLILRAAHHLRPLNVAWAAPLGVLVIVVALAITLIAERTPIAWLFGASRARASR